MTSSNGPVVLVTGATSGIGLQTALDLASDGARVLIHGRSREKAAKVADALRESGAESPGLYVADLGSMKQVRSLARRIIAEQPQLDVLINNAAVFMRERKLTPDGLETTFAVNHLAPLLLTQLLLDLIQHSEQGRIINVSSNTHQRARIEFDDLQAERKYDGYQAYAASKLGNVLFTYALARRLRDTPVTVNALHPGVIQTQLLRDAFGGGGASLAQGAATPVYLATSPEVTGISGQYFANRKPVASSDASHDVAVQERLYSASLALAGLPAG